MIGQQLNNRYNVKSRLGKGAMGTVYLALDEQNGREVAIKVIARELALDPNMLERFKREGESLRQLKHVNIVGYVDAFEHDEHYVIVMEYVPGGSLYDLIKKGPLPIDQAVQIALDLCDALIRSHRLKIIHRDIKPENILIAEDETPKLADFGVARLSEGTRMTRSGMQVGTPYYMAPEAWEGKTLDEQADIWSVGIVLFEMLSGRLPFDGDTPIVVMHKISTETPPDLKKLRKEVPPGFVDIINRMLTKDKNLRYHSMREVAADLERGEPISKVNFINSNSRLQVKTSILTNLPRTYRAVFIIFAIVAVGIFILLDNFNRLQQTPGDFTAIPTNSPISTASLPVLGVPNNEGVSPGDGMPMVFVPEGSFTMGNNNGENDESPEANIILSSYWIDQTEVTNEMYAKCISDGICTDLKSTTSLSHLSYFGNPDFFNYPVINVDWFQAGTYCIWAGRRLPTEAEWEKAARGTDKRLYPWGNEFDGHRLNFCDLNCQFGNKNESYDDGYKDLSPVGTYELGLSYYGAYDMSGNAWEWVNSAYKPYPFNPDDGRENPDGGDVSRVLRGGSRGDSLVDVTVTNRLRSLPDFINSSFGFRCAVSSE